MSFTLRDLPLPVKVVVSVFLMAVGVGYTSAMLQLHMQDAKSGTATPSLADVILKYTGKKKRADLKDPALVPMSRLEALVTNPVEVISGQSMSAAFTTRDPASGDLKFANATKGKTPEQVAEVRAQRAGEQLALKLWINTPDAERKAAYAANRFTPPAGTMTKPITAAFKDEDAIKIKSIIDTRCVACHETSKEDVPLDAYDHLTKHMIPPAGSDPNSEWVRVQEPISITKLTQSTHAHLLSFAVLFSLTGLIFACSSYRVWVRCIVGPWVVLAVFADVSLWWLARLCDQWGPYFAMGIIGTGALAGMGLGAQITLSLLNMYGTKGKAVILALFLLGAGVAGLVVVKKIIPGLEEKEKEAQKQNAGPPKNDNNGQGATLPKLDEGQKKQVRDAWEDLKSADAAKKQAAQQTLDKLVTEARRKRIEEAQKELQSDKQEVRAAAQEKLKKLKEECGIADVPVVKLPPSEIERLLLFPKDASGKPLTWEEMPFNAADDGGMVPAFFKQDSKFKNKMNDPAVPPAEKDKVLAERNGEHQALLAWTRLTDPARKSAYETDRLDLPADLTGKPFTPEYLKDGKALIKTIINDRCTRCHQSGAKREDTPFTTYDEILQQLKPPAPKEK